MALLRQYAYGTLIFLLSSTLAWAAAPSRTYTYTIGSIIKTNEVTTNEDSIYSYLQAGVDTILDGSIVAADIAGATITYNKIQNVSATSKVLGRTSAGAGSIEEITFSTAAQDLSQETFADDQVWVADSATAGTPRTLTNCTDASGNHLNYTQATNTFSCGTSSSVTSGVETGTWAAAANSKDTVYQNTGGKKRRVSITMDVPDASAKCDMLVGVANPPTIYTASSGQGGASGAVQHIYLYTEVPSNHYYEMVSTAGTCTIGTWSELNE